MSVLYEMKMFSFLKLSISIDDIWKNKIDIYVDMIKKIYLRIKCFLQCIWCKKGLPLKVVPQCEMNTALYIKVSYGISFYLIISQNVHIKWKYYPTQLHTYQQCCCCCQWKFDKYSSLNDFCWWKYVHNTVNQILLACAIFISQFTN